MKRTRIRPIGAGYGRMTANRRDQLRLRYQEIWGRDWPEDDTYLAVLWREAVDANPVNWQQTHIAARVEFCLTRMRENHTFEAVA